MDNIQTSIVSKGIYAESNLELTESLLTHELSEWKKQFGSGRNDIDLRFGQYIWCKYDMKEIFPEPSGRIDGFGPENPSIAFVQILEALNNKL